MFNWHLLFSFLSNSLVARSLSNNACMVSSAAKLTDMKGCCKSTDEV
jgi:hypothetical protein